MSKRTDTEEAIQFPGTVTITASPNPQEYGGGNIEVEGAVFTDIILENTLNLGVNLEGIIFNNSHFTTPLLSPPAIPPTGNIRFYTDTADSLFKSKNSSGTVTIYQPTNTKGDLLTHNGTTQTKLTIGSDLNVLIADSSTPSGIKWGNVSHNNLTDLLNDVHTQYALLSGRNNGQILIGGTAAGNNLTLQSTSNITKGSILMTEITESTSTSTGSLVVSGGVGINKNLHIGNNLTVNGNITISNTTDAISITDGGSFTTLGGLSIAKKLFVGTNINLGGSSLLPSKLFLTGTDSNTADGPHIIATTSSDIYPLYQNFNWSHDALYLNFDVYFDETAYRFSHTTVGYQIAKANNELQFNVTSGTPVPGNVAIGTRALFINNQGVINLPKNITSTSTTSGSLVVTGGIGVSGKAHIGNGIVVQNTETANTGSTIAAFINTSGAERIFIIDENATGFIPPGIVSNTGYGLGFTSSGTGPINFYTTSSKILRASISNSGIFNLTNTSASTSNTSGAFTTSGGISISNTTDAISITNGGSFTTSGGASISKKLFIGGVASFLNTINMNNTKIVNLQDPVVNSDAATKNYVDSVAQGLSVKDSVVAATVASANLSTDYENLDIIDGITLATGDRILIKNQTNGVENGIYIVQTTGSPIRASDFSLGSSQGGSFVFIKQGSVNANNGFVVTNTAPNDIVGTDAIIFTQFSGAGSIIPGTGILRDGNTLSVNSDLSHVVQTGTLLNLTVTPGNISGVTLSLSSLSASQAIHTDSSKNLISIPLTGSGNSVLQTSPTLITPIIGDASASSIIITDTTSSISNTTGSLKTSGGIGISNTTDAISITNGGSFTTAGGIAIAKKVFIGSNLFIGGTTLFNNYFDTLNITAPPIPSTSNIRFYTDTSDSLFKSKNSSGIVTIYQPTNTKGDLSTHNGTTQAPLPVGNNNSVLVADSTNTTGLKWSKLDLVERTLNFAVSNKPIIYTEYTHVSSIIYEGSNNTGLFSEFRISSFKNSSNSYTYSVRIWDSINKQVICEIIGLNNEDYIVNSTTVINNLPATKTILECHCKLSVYDGFGIIVNSVGFVY